MVFFRDYINEDFKIQTEGALKRDFSQSWIKDPYGEDQAKSNFYDNRFSDYAAEWTALEKTKPCFRYFPLLLSHGRNTIVYDELEELVSELINDFARASMKSRRIQYIP